MVPAQVRYMDITNRAAPAPRARGFGRPVVALASAFYAITVAVSLGGTWRAALAAAMAGAVGGALHFAAAARREADLARSFAAALAATLAALLLGPALAPHELGCALFGGLALLAPVA